MTKYDISN